MTGIEPIKASTLAQFYWCAIEAYITHLKEIGDDRVTGGSKDSEALREGEKLHARSFGLRVHPMEEDTGGTILEKMTQERVTAVNHGNYQVQGAPDTVTHDGDTARVRDMKTTGWDDRSFYLLHQGPPAEFQVQIYSWMLSRVPGIEVLNPVIQVKQREDGRAIDWFEHEVEYDQDEVGDKIDRVLTHFQEPEKLEELRPSADWKCRNDDHWEQYQRIVLDR